MKLLITGGHLTPALAVIDHILKNEKYKQAEIVFVGRKYAVESEHTISLEYKEITKRQIPFISLNAGRLSRLLNVRTMVQIVKIPIGFIQSLYIICMQKPDLILSFGGYLALPVASVGWLCRIPVYTHEQTISPGITNRIIGFFSKRVFFSFPDTGNVFKSKKSLLTGNPVRETVFQKIDRPFELSKDLPVVYVTGGSLGSHSINEHIFEILHPLLETYVVIHQTGDIQEYGDYERALQIKKRLDPTAASRYYPVKHLFDTEIGYVYSVTDLVVGRAGANTFFELVQLKKPAILVPLPWSARKEQQKHAALFAHLGLGVIFEQKEKSTVLLEKIHDVGVSLGRYKKHFNMLPTYLQKNATEIIVHTIMGA